SFQKKKENANKEEAEVKGEVKIAFNFCKKILETDDCEILILDGILDALELGFIDEDELINVLNERSDSMGIIITGRKKNHKVSTLADYIFHIIPEKVF
ncbi:MAG: cob(I)yrinic acid a,c-diamide adenosyltransferase, partial [Anaerotignaceae bacterium]